MIRFERLSLSHRIFILDVSVVNDKVKVRFSISVNLWLAKYPRFSIRAYWPVHALLL